MARALVATAFGPLPLNFSAIPGTNFPNPNPWSCIGIGRDKPKSQKRESYDESEAFKHLGNSTQ